MKKIELTVNGVNKTQSQIQREITRLENKALKQLRNQMNFDFSIEVKVKY